MTDQDPQQPQVPQVPQVPQTTPAIKPMPRVDPPPPPPRPKGTTLRSKFMQTIFILMILSSFTLNVILICVIVRQYKETFETSVMLDGDSDEVVAVYTIRGTIDNRQARLFDKFYRKVHDDDNIKAVVIRIESPGGGVSASDNIMQKVRAIREKLGKPVVVSMGAVAASGGYYISTPADIIYAEPNTITGSIGVLAIWPVVKDFLDKHGVDIRIIRSTQAKKWKARTNPFEKPEKYVSDDMIASLTRMHDMFAQVVIDGRGEKLKITKTEVTMTDENGQTVTVPETSPFNGKVFIAEDARKLGLVDKIGYLDDAVAAAAALRGLSKPKAVRFTRRVSLGERVGFAGAGPIIDKELVESLMTPKIMMIWKAE